MNGTITVEAMGGALTIDAGDGTFTLTGLDPTDELGTVASSTTSSKTTEFKALVTQESSLFFKGRNIVTKSVDTDQGTIVPVVQIEGAADIAEGVTLGGDGILSLDSGGHLSIQGTVESDERHRFRRRYGPSFDRQSYSDFLEHLDFLKRQVPELISRESKLSPWAYTLQARFKNSCFMRGQIRRAIGLLTLKFTALMKRAFSQLTES